jgi:hypothetical protein
MQDEIYGASTRQMMLDAGLCAGMRVLDRACGTGIMSHWIAGQVGPMGDISRDQSLLRSPGIRDILVSYEDIFVRGDGGIVCAADWGAGGGSVARCGAPCSAHA